MSKYKFIKSKLQISQELYQLWSNYDLYKFVNGVDWIRQRELEIAECLTMEDRETWIELCRSLYLMDAIEIDLHS